MAGTADRPGVGRGRVRASEEHGRPAPRPQDRRDLRQLPADCSRGDPFTSLLNGVPKYVVGRTLAGPLAWQGSTLVAGGLAERITAVKERHDEVHVIGSLDLVQSLLRFGLVDRLHLWLYPLLLGSGKQVFADGTVPTALRLTESATYPSGTLQLDYETAGVPCTATSPSKSRTYNDSPEMASKTRAGWFQLGPAVFGGLPSNARQITPDRAFGAGRSDPVSK